MRSHRNRYVFAVATAVTLASVATVVSAEAMRPRFGPGLVVLGSSHRHAELFSDWTPQLVASKSGVWMTVWHSDDDGDGTLGSDNDIFLSRSTDKGRTWSEPLALNRNAAGDTGSDRLPSAATDGKGNWVVVWQTNDTLGGTIRNDVDIVYARSRDDGASWTDPAPITADALGDWGADEQAHVATDGNGAWVVAWSSTNALGHKLGGDRDILFTRSSDNGRTWGAAQPLVETARTDQGFDVEVRVAHGREGNWLAVWTSSDSLGGRIGTDTDLLYARSADGGQSWSNPMPLSSRASTDRFGDAGAALTTDGRGNWVTVWTSGDAQDDRYGMDRDVLVARSADDGATWTVPEAVNAYAANDSRDDTAPTVVTDGRGGWMAVWHSWHPMAGPDIGLEGLDYDLYQSGAGTDADVVVASSTDGGATWTRPTIVSKVARDDIAEDLRPSVATDGEGSWMIVWESINRSAAREDVDWGIVGAFGKLEPVASTHLGTR